MGNQRNLVLAVLLSGVLLLGWDAAMRWFWPQPDKPVAQQGATASAGAQADTAQHTREGGLTDPGAIAEEKLDLASALKMPGRITIKAPGLSGSINPVGAVIDDLTINRHRATVEKDSGPTRMFSPAGTPAQHYARFGWTGQNIALPGPGTVWTAPAGAVLTPQTPVALSWANGQGQVFAIRFAIDADYMITATQTVSNAGAAPVSLQPVAQISRTDRTASLDSWNVHSGPIGAFDQTVNFDTDYDDLAETGKVAPEGRSDWLGFTDIYWLSALIPAEGVRATADFRALGDGTYLANLFHPAAAVAVGKASTTTTRLFAGAKESTVLDRYQADGIANFGLAIDWGWFRWFERPIFLLLDKLFGLAGNFGVAIILLTLIIRGVMFPVAQRQFASMAAMRAIQPKLKALQERYKDDRTKLQQETMALYKAEGVNPLAGCLPILIQIPIFFALYKVLILTIEMRHQPFVLWIKDLSAPDPMHILNLFGLLPFDVPAFLGIGVLAILLGVTMWLQFRLNPAAMDPMQQQIFAIMPWVMMFVMAPFAAGLLVYWITSNILTIAQQTYLYRKHPQLKAQAEKDKVDQARAGARDSKPGGA